ncbi:antitoxin endoAI [Oxobacter pfennigii]|uniref:Antitoxin endoAI n=1 Tax=Oxobacter pfennigii TaxID=36849 RepID=A0A0P8Y9C6_9CLOT|nr:ribbon-helix-helix protein, CopG family [Oxobacter pfennigii]KPU43407.1 antitoxin endoAI [Oxobacter pfennigii]
MAESKKIIVDLPESMLDEFDEILMKDNKNRSEFIMEAIILYIEEKKKHRLREKMRLGYIEMANMNQEIAEFGFAIDQIDLCKYEARLAECDVIDDDDGETRRYILC